MPLPAVFAVPGVHLQPDRLSIWPVEDGTFGLDVTYTGADGFRRADAVERALATHQVQCGLRQELDDGWTVRLGPVDRRAMLAALNGLVR